MGIKELDKEYVAGTYKRFPVAFVKGKGSLLWDDTGKEYIDMGAGIAVNTLGLCDEIWVRDVTEQLGTLQHTSNLYATAPQAELARMLCERTGFKKVFFSNSGAEANECMIKTARKYAHDAYGEARQGIITLRNSFHGRTITTLSATGQKSFHKDFGPFTPGFSFAEPDDAIGLQRLVQEQMPAAIMIEIVQGEGGVKTLSKSFCDAIAAICKKHDILLLVDEVQTGNGRTGTLYAYMQYGLQPDIISTAKGLAGGLPLGATLFGEKTAGVMDYGSHGSTFGGNPVCAAGALSTLSRIDDELLMQVDTKGKYIRQQISSWKGVKSISGLGLMIGIESEKPAGEIVSACLAKGVALLTAHDKVRLLPALNIPYALIDRVLAVLKQEIEPITQENTEGR